MRKGGLIFGFSLAATIVSGIIIIIFELFEKGIPGTGGSAFGFRDLAYLKATWYDPLRGLYLFSFLAFLILTLIPLAFKDRRVTGPAGPGEGEGSMRAVAGKVPGRMVALVFSSLFAASLTLRLFLYFHTNPDHLPLGKDWHDWVLGTRAFLSMDFSLYHEVRRPLSPLLSAFFTLFTGDPVSGGHYLSIVAGSLIPAVAGVTGLINLGLAGGLFMGLLLLPYPVLVEYSLHNSGYSLYALLTSLLFLVAARTFLKRGRGGFLLSGFLSGLILLTMLKGLLPVAATTLYLVALALSGGNLREKASKGSIALLLILTPALILFASSYLLPVEYVPLEDLILSSDQDALHAYGEVDSWTRTSENLKELSRLSPLFWPVTLALILSSPLLTPLLLLPARAEKGEMAAFHVDIYALILLITTLIHIPFIFTPKYAIHLLVPFSYLLFRGISALSAIICSARKGLFIPSIASLSIIFLLFSIPYLKRGNESLFAGGPTQQEGYAGEYRLAGAVAEWLNRGYGEGTLLFSNTSLKIRPLLKGSIRWMNVPEMGPEKTLETLRGILGTREEGEYIGNRFRTFLLLTDNLRADGMIVPDFEERFTQGIEGSVVERMFSWERPVSSGEREEIILLILRLDFNDIAPP